MADPVQKPDISSPPAAKGQPASPKASAPAAQVKAKPAELQLKQNGKLRMEPLNVNLGRSGLPQESAFPVKKAAAKPAPGAKPAPPAKPQQAAASR